MTGRMFHFRYCSACKDDRFNAGKLTVAQAAKINFYLLSGTEPYDTFVDECFPKAAEARRKFASDNHLEEWALQTIEQLWHHEHNKTHTGNCAVRFGVVVTIYNNRNNLVRVKVEEEDATMVCSNPFNPDLKEEIGRASCRERVLAMV
jgi:hypothetical protein